LPKLGELGVDHQPVLEQHAPLADHEQPDGEQQETDHDERACPDEFR
jgi:hypothetical protein